MELNKNFMENEVERIGDFADIEFGIDKEDEWIIFKSFTNYSNSIGSSIREVVSNAFDAHLDANSNKNVQIALVEENILKGTPAYLSIRDYGTGMSPEIIKTIYSKFGKSTKRNRPNSIGAYGFGAKAPLSYQDMFDLITIVDGVEYHYSIHKGERRPIITLINEQPTTADNGTEVRITIKEGDKYRFKDELKTQLKYFDNITYTNCDISNNYRIIKGNHFVHRVDLLDVQGTQVSERGRMHLCLGKVRYPIDVNSINFTLPNLDIGLYFDIGEIPVVWNRESVEYQDGISKLIKQKYDKAISELRDLYSSQMEEIDSLEKLFNTTNTFSTIPIYEENGTTYKLPFPDSGMTKVLSYPKYSYLKIKDTSDIKRAVMLESSNEYYSGSARYLNFQDNTVATYFLDKGESLSKVKSEYLYSLHTSRFIRAVYPKKHVIKTYLRNFAPEGFVPSPFDFPKEERQGYIREVYELYDEFMEYIQRHTKKYSEVEVSQEFLNVRKKQEKERKERLKERFNYKVCTNGYFARHRTQGSDLKRAFRGCTVIYGFQKDRDALIEVSKFIYREFEYPTSQRFKIISISKNNERVIKEELEGKAYPIHKINDIPAIKRIPKKYSFSAFLRDFKQKYQGSKLVEHCPSADYIPSKISNIPSISEEKRLSLYKTIGTKLKYPLLPWINRGAPAKLINVYKEAEPYHHVNPILITKLYIKKHEQSENNSTEE